MLFSRNLSLLFIAGQCVFGSVAHAFDAAGRLDFQEQGGSCSGILVAPGIVATAAHCTPEPRDDGTLPIVRFVTPASQVMPVISAVADHPLYNPGTPKVAWLFRFDIGVAAFESTTLLSEVAPVTVGTEAVPGETLVIASWRAVDGPKPRFRPCTVLESGTEGLVTLDCQVVGGESGAPVLRQTDSGYELVAIVSSRATLMSKPVSQASDVRLRLPPLLDLISAPSKP